MADQESDNDMNSDDEEWQPQEEERLRRGAPKASHFPRSCHAQMAVSLGREKRGETGREIFIF